MGGGGQLGADYLESSCRGQEYVIGGVSGSAITVGILVRHIRYSESRLDDPRIEL